MNKMSLLDQINEIDYLIMKYGSSDLLENVHDTLDKLRKNNDNKCDFQGWKINDYTLGDLRKLIDGTKDLPSSTKIRVLEDDGMGYGANNGSCTDMYLSEDNDGNNEIKVWF